MLKFITYLDTISLLIVALIGIFLFRKIAIEFKVFVVFLFYGSVTGITAAILSGFKIHNLFLFNILSLLEYLVYAYMLFMWPANKLVSFSIVISAVIYSILWYWTTFNIMGFQEYNFYIRMLNAVLMVLFSGILLVNISDFTKKHMLNDARFWMGVSWIMFFSINIIIYVFAGIIMNGKGESSVIGIEIKSLANIIEYILFAIALVCSSTKRKSF